MASVVFIRGRWRVQIRHRGQRPLQRSFRTRREAQVWAGQHALQKPSDRSRIDDLVSSYLAEGRCGESKRRGLESLRRRIPADWSVDRLSVDQIVRWGRGRHVSPATLMMELSYLGSVLAYARLVWGLSIPDSVRQARAVLSLEGLAGKSRERDRRPTNEELAAISAWLGRSQRIPWADLIQFSIHTTMRASEVTGLLWDNLNESDQTVLVRDRKDPRRKRGNSQWVPLLEPAWAIVQRQPTRAGRIFPYNPATFSSRFPKACRALGIRDLRWHDLRHEGISRLFEMGYQIHEVALFSGHKDWKQLARYTQLRAGQLRRLSAASSATPRQPSAASPAHEQRAD